MWHLATWLSGGVVCAGLMVILDNMQVLSNLNRFCESIYSICLKYFFMWSCSTRSNCEIKYAAWWTTCCLFKEQVKWYSRLTGRRRGGQLHLMITGTRSALLICILQKNFFVNLLFKIRLTAWSVDVKRQGLISPHKLQRKRRIIVGKAADQAQVWYESALTIIKLFQFIVS